VTALLCALLLSGLPRHDTCHAVAAEAQRQGVPVVVALAVGWQESRFNADAVSKRGAVGPLQVMPHHHPGDPLEQGVAKLRRLHDELASMVGAARADELIGEVLG